MTPSISHRYRIIRLRRDVVINAIHRKVFGTHTHAAQQSHYCQH